MGLPQKDEYELFQNYQEFSESAPSLTKKQTLIELYKAKMPDEKIQEYTKTQTGQEDKDSIFDYSISKNITIEERGKAPIYFLESKPLGEKAISLQKWQGVVLSVEKEFFSAKLINLTDTGYDEEAEFPIEEITYEDIELIKPGAIFYWSIGYHHSRSGQRTRFSQIRFRRLPSWSKEELETAKSEAKQIRDFIGWK